MITLYTLILSYIFLSLCFYALFSWNSLNNNLHDNFQVELKVIPKNFWIGFYLNKKQHKLYLSVVPTLMVIIDYKPDKEKLFWKRLSI